MELSKFLSTTLTGIIKGVQQAQKEMGENGGVVNPPLMYGADSAPKGRLGGKSVINSMPVESRGLIS